MSYQQYGVGEYWQGAPERANPNPLAEYDTSPEVAYNSQSGPGYNQEESDQSGGLGASGGGIWGTKRKIFIVVLGIFIIIIIALAAGVGGVAAIVAKNNDRGAPEPQNPSASADPSQSSASSSEGSGSVRPSSVKSSSERPSSEISSSVSTRRTISTLLSISATPTPTPILKNTPLAAVNWNSSSIQLFYKDTDHNIRRLDYDGSKWGKPTPPIFKPRDDSGIAAISWFEGGPQRQEVRVYTLNVGNSLVETVWNSSQPGTWDTNLLSSTLDPAAAGSQLTAYTWGANGVRNIRVYYQGQDGYIREAVYTAGSGTGWRKGDAPKIEDFPQAKNGSGLAVLLYSERNQAEDASLFYQNMEGKLVSYDYKRAATFVESWKKSTTDLGPIPDRAHITAVVNKSGNQTLRIYFTQGGMLKETWSEQAGGLKQSWNMASAAAPGVAAISYSDDVRVFFQHSTENISSESLNRQRDKWEFSWVG